MQATDAILLVRPTNFGYNSETAYSNAFQFNPKDIEGSIHENALQEFTAMYTRLLENKISCIVIDDTVEPVKPDAIFPNNWISMHANGLVVIYPMLPENRRLEKRIDIIEALQSKFKIKEIFDLSYFEKEYKFLEGTGSIVFDHANKLAFACISPRTNAEVLQVLCKKIGYKPVTFNGIDDNGKAIYHTNVMMCVGNKFVVICLEAVANKDEREMLKQIFAQHTLQVIPISTAQMKQFAGNMLLVKNKDEKSLLLLSQTASQVLTIEQITVLSNYCELLPIAIPTIETYGGGSVRCMMAEVFLERITI